MSRALQEKGGEQRYGEKGSLRGWGRQTLLYGRSTLDPQYCWSPRLGFQGGNRHILEAAPTTSLCCSWMLMDRSHLSQQQQDPFCWGSSSAYLYTRCLSVVLWWMLLSRIMWLTWPQNSSTRTGV